MSDSSNQRRNEPGANPGGPVSGLRGAVSLRGARRWLEFEGCRLAWTERVRASVEPSPEQTVVCLHDLNAGSREFAPLIEHSQAGYRLVMLDWPGHGYSEDWPGADPGVADGQAEALSMATLVRMVDAVMDAVDAVEAVEAVDSVDLVDLVASESAGRRATSRRVTVAGSGFGAGVAVAYAAAHPERVLGLVLNQPAGLLPAARPVGGVNGLFRRLKLGRGRGLTPAVRQALRCAVAARECGGIAQTLYRALCDSQEVLRWAAGTVECPMLIALSRESKRYPMEQSLSLLEQMLADAPQHRLTVFTGGSNPIWDEPKRFAIALASHVQSQLPLEIHHHGWILAGVDWPARGVNLWRCVHTECGAERILPTGADANSVAESTA